MEVSKGFEAGKKISKRKRHILTDADGRLPTVRVQSADIEDRDGLNAEIVKRSRYPIVQRVDAAGGYAGGLVEAGG